VTQAEIIEDQQRRAREPQQLALMAAVAAGGSRLCKTPLK
jgi:hypothetical protein